MDLKLNKVVVYIRDISVHKLCNTALILAIIYMNFTGYLLLSLPLATALVFAEIAITVGVSLSITRADLKTKHKLGLLCSTFLLWLMCGIGIYKNVMEDYYRDTKEVNQIILNNGDIQTKIDSINIKIDNTSKVLTGLKDYIKTTEQVITDFSVQVNNITKSVGNCATSLDCSYRRDNMVRLQNLQSTKLDNDLLSLEEITEQLKHLRQVRGRLESNRLSESLKLQTAIKYLEDNYGIFRKIFKTDTILEGYQTYVIILSVILYFLYLVSLFIEKKYPPLSDLEKELILKERIKESEEPIVKEVIKYETVDKIIDNYILVSEDDTSVEILNKIDKSKKG